jgi:CheY-like chemotaxis protein
VHVLSARDPDPAALRMGAVGFETKPASREQVMAVIRKLEGKFSQDIRRVLVVEDNEVQRQSIQKLIGGENVRVQGAETGEEAMKALRSGSFDCVILDLALTDMSGYDLLERMSAAEGAVMPPVIVYTGRSLTREEEMRLQRYSRTIILKGARSPERLLSEVTLFLHQVESKLPPDRQRTLHELRDRSEIFEARTVLLVDDDVRNIFALNSALEARGAKVEIARNGREAVEKVQALAGKIDLVLMDIMMPEMDGYEATRRIRQDARFARLPIIAVTAKAMADDQEKCLKAGANDYLAKPIELPKLLSLIRVWLQPSARA